MSWFTVSVTATHVSSLLFLSVFVVVHIYVIIGIIQKNSPTVYQSIVYVGQGISHRNK